MPERPRRRDITAPGPLRRQGRSMSHPLMYPRACRPLRPVLVGTTAIALAVALGAGGPAAAAAATAGKLVRVSNGDPFVGCTADKVAKQQGKNYPNTEVEPFAAADP